MQSLAVAFGAALINASTSAGSRYPRNFFVLPFTPGKGKELAVFLCRPLPPRLLTAALAWVKSFTFRLLVSCRRFTFWIFLDELNSFFGRGDDFGEPFLDLFAVNLPGFSLFQSIIGSS